MTAISMGGATPPLTGGPSGADRRRGTGDAGGERANGLGQLLERIDPRVREYAPIGACVAALGGIALLRRPVQSKVIGVVDGVELLSNPRLPRGVKAGHGAAALRRPDHVEAMVAPADEHVVVHVPGRSVAVTRELPLGSDGHPVLGGRGPDDSVYWSAYIEKAQAAVARNGYRSLEGGHVHQSFRQLFGTNPVEVASRGTIADDLVHHHAEGVPLGLETAHRSSFRRAERQLMKELQVFASHAYIVTDVQGTGDDVAVTRFNPCGEKHPKRPLRIDELRALFTGLETPDAFVRYSPPRQLPR